MLDYFTKSKYLNGLQCHKRLWYEKNHPERAVTTSTIPRAQQRIFDESNEVKKLAQDYLSKGEGEHIEAIGSIESANQTQDSIKRGVPYIFGASFIFNDIYVRCDILQKDSDSWEIIGIKSSTQVKERHLDELAIQKYVLTEQGISISRTLLILINNEECVYPDLSNLFTIEYVTNEVDRLIDNIPNNIQTFKNILDENIEPPVLIGRHCEKPNRCSFKEHCWKSVPKFSIFTIPRLFWNKKDELVEEGILNLDELSDDNLKLLNTKQQAYVDMVAVNRPKIDTKKIKKELSDLEYPIHFFDFETYNPVIPRFEGSSPFQQIPFQYSCHILQLNGEVTHHEYLHTDTTDPRLPLVESLLDHISDVGSVVVYSASFERKILKDLAQFFSKHSAAIESIISRLWDQLLIFRNHYQHPEFLGSNSIKNVLPVLVPSLSYKELGVRNGGDAQIVWDLMIRNINEKEKSNMIHDLRKYCELDTLAMVEIHKVLVQL